MGTKRYGNDTFLPGDHQTGYGKKANAFAFGDGRQDLVDIGSLDIFRGNMMILQEFPAVAVSGSIRICQEELFVFQLFNPYARLTGQRMAGRKNGCQFICRKTVSCFSG